MDLPHESVSRQANRRSTQMYVHPARKVGSIVAGIPIGALQNAIGIIKATLNLAVAPFSTLTGKSFKLFNGSNPPLQLGNALLARTYTACVDLFNPRAHEKRGVVRKYNYWNQEVNAQIKAHVERKADSALMAKTLLYLRITRGFAGQWENSSAIKNCRPGARRVHSQTSIRTRDCCRRIDGYVSWTRR